MPRPRLTAAVVFLLLVPNLGLAVMGDTLVVTPIASLSFVLLCVCASFGPHRSPTAFHFPPP